jgi:hypothetical protein
MSRCRAHSAACDQILLSVRMLMSGSCCLVFVGLLSDERSDLSVVIWIYVSCVFQFSKVCIIYTKLLSALLGTADYALLVTRRRSQSRSYFTTDGQSVSMSWYRALLLDLRPDIISCRNVAVWNLRSCFCGTPSLTRGLVCNLQYNHSMVRVAQDP